MEERFLTIEDSNPVDIDSDVPIHDVSYGAISDDRLVRECDSCYWESFKKSGLADG